MGNRDEDRHCARGQIARIVDSAVGLFALAVYLVTLATTITWRNNGGDGGDLVSAAYTLGIPHPPGYPLYTLIAAVFAHLPIGNPAQNVGVFSATAAAGVVFLLAFAARKLIRVNRPRGTGQFVAPAIACAFAFTPAFWSQAVIPEVYALNVFLATALLGALFSDSPNRLAIAAGLFGLGFAHHLSIALFIPSAALLLTDRRWSGGEIMWAAVLFLAPLLFYLYLPLRAFAHPPVNWGDPHTLEGFWWVVSAAPYRSYLLSLSAADILARVRATADLFFQQFQPWGVVLGLWGIAQMSMNQDQQTRRRFWALGLASMLMSGYAIVYGSRDSYVYLLPVFIIFALWVAYGTGDLAEHFAGRGTRVALASLLFFLPIYNVVTNFQTMDLSRDRQAFTYAREVFMKVPGDAIIITEGDDHLFALWYYRYVVAGDSSCVTIINPGLLQYDWYWNELRQSISGLDNNSLPGSLQASYLSRLEVIINYGLDNKRAIYTTATGFWLSDYVFQAQPPLFWILKRAR